MKLLDIVRRNFLPPLMEKGINAAEYKHYKIVSNQGGYSAKISIPSWGDFFSVEDGLSDDFYYRESKHSNNVEIFETEEDASIANWEHFEKYNRSKILMYGETFQDN